MVTDIPLPPGITPETLARIPARHREDAIQEAWVAHLENKNPRWAIRRYLAGEIRYEQTHTSLSEEQADNQGKKQFRAGQSG